MRDKWVLFNGNPFPYCNPPVIWYAAAPPVKHFIPLLPLLPWIVANYCYNIFYFIVLVLTQKASEIFGWNLALGPYMKWNILCTIVEIHCYKLEMFTRISLSFGKWNVIFFCVYDIITRLISINPPLYIFSSICSVCHAIKTPIVEVAAIVRICVQPVGHVTFWYSSSMMSTFFKIRLLTG